MTLRTVEDDALSDPSTYPDFDLCKAHFFYHRIEDNFHVILWNLQIRRFWNSKSPDPVILEFKTTGSGGFPYTIESYHYELTKYRMALHVVEDDTPSDVTTSSIFYFC